MADVKDEVERITKVVRDTIKQFSGRKLKEIENLKYYFSHQWRPEEIDERLAEGKPVVTFNHIKRYVNWLFGVIKQMDLEVKAVPRSVVSEKSSEIVTGIIRTVLNEQRNRDAIDSAMMNAFIGGVGFVWIYLDFEEDPNGAIRIKNLDPVDVYFDTLSEAKDFTDARYLFFFERLHEKEIRERYKEKIKKIEKIGFSFDAGIDYLSLKEAENLEMKEFLETYTSLLKSAYGNFYPVLHFREKIMVEEPALYNTVTGVYITFPRLKNEDELYAYAYELNNQAGENIFKVDTVSVKRVKFYTLLGNYIVEEYENLYGTHYYDVVPFYSYKLGRFYQGFVDDLIDPQDELNYRKSLFNEILKNMPVDSFWIPKGSMTDLEMEVAQEKLKKPKQLIPIRYEYGQPVPIVSDVISKLSALVQLEQLLRMDMRELGGMVDALMGIVPRKLQSGKAITALQQWGFIPFEAIFSNYFYSLYIIGNIVWKIARFVYSKRDKIRILAETGDYEFIDINLETELGKINQILMDDYDVYLTVRAKTTDEMTEKFMELVQLRQLGVPVPDEYLIMYSKVPDKKRLIEIIAQLRAQIMQQQSEEE